eukprot:9931715-Alexandrium_andersonii.AAC.1
MCLLDAGSETAGAVILEWCCWLFGWSVTDVGALANGSCCACSWAGCWEREWSYSVRRELCATVNGCVFMGCFDTDAA